MKNLLKCITDDIIEETKNDLRKKCTALCYEEEIPESMKSEE